MKWFNYWKEFCYNWLVSLGMKPENIKMRDHSPEELSHYSNATTDIEYLFPFGWGELWGIADRTDFDLRQHQNTSGQSMEYVDPVTNEKFLPYCIEPSLGADRVALAFLCDAYDEEQLENETRVVLRLSPVLAPFKAAVLPLQKQLNDKAQEVYHMLLKDHMVDFDTTGSIGKRYRRQDEIGTPCCITIDFETLETNTVTVRDRDTMQQIRLEIGQLSAYLSDLIKF
jgi:glycyl-tRNA synthetase